MKVPLAALASFALLLLAPLASATNSSAFGSPGTPRFDTYVPPASLKSANGAGEPSIGIPWNTDHAFYQSFATTYKVVFDAQPVSGATWTDVSPVFTPINVDPMLHADHVSDRIWAGGLAGACSLMGISDDDGGSWVPAGNMCNFAQFDHQSIGSGAWSSSPVPRGTVYPRATYYCSQLQQGTPFGDSPGTACTTSVNGGLAWLPFTEVLGGCGGLHGHIRVSEVTGTAAVPDGSCNSGEGSLPGGVVTSGTSVDGFGYTADNGATWNSRFVPGSRAGNGFDPSLDFSRKSGWLYYAQADDLGIHVAMSKNDGKTFETLGNDQAGAEPSTWLNLSALYTDPHSGKPLKFGTFADVLVGDDDRAVVSFLGATDGAHPFDDADCGKASDQVIWHPYLAQTFDAGQSWTVTRLTEDPIQVGAIWGGGGGQACRNLLDFADIDMDSHGRVHIALADGCLDKCAQAYFDWIAGKGPAPTGNLSRDSYATILRQTTGLGLLSKFDGTGVKVPGNMGPGGTITKGTPGFGPVALLLAVSAAFGVLRSRRGKRPD